MLQYCSALSCLADWSSIRVYWWVNPCVPRNTTVPQMTVEEDDPSGHMTTITGTLGDKNGQFLPFIHAVPESKFNSRSNTKILCFRTYPDLSVHLLCVVISREARRLHASGWPEIWLLYPWAARSVSMWADVPADWRRFLFPSRTVIFNCLCEETSRLIKSRFPSNYCTWCGWLSSSCLADPTKQPRAFVIYPLGMNECGRKRRGSCRARVRSTELCTNRTCYALAAWRWRWLPVVVFLMSSQRERRQIGYDNLWEITGSLLWLLLSFSVLIVKNCSQLVESVKMGSIRILCHSVIWMKLPAENFAW